MVYKEGSEYREAPNFEGQSKKATRDWNKMKLDPTMGVRLDNVQWEKVVIGIFGDIAYQIEKTIAPTALATPQTIDTARDLCRIIYKNSRMIVELPEVTKVMLDG